MKKTIYHDAILSFGKYKGKAAEDILDDDPGYFLWCRESGTHSLDSVIESEVNIWAAGNKAEAAKTTASATKVRKTREDEREAKRSSGDYLPSVSDDVSFAVSAVPSVAKEAWGTW